MIGVFDSGLGGISVFNVLRKKFPQADFVYFGDTARVPYGPRGEEVIKQYCHEGAEFLQKIGAEIIVIACNTATAVARSEFEKTGLPVVDVIVPIIEAVKEGGFSRVGVIGTQATVNTHIYARLLQEIGLPQVREVACPILTTLVEEGLEKHPGTKLFLEDYLAPFRDSRLEALILGCTHYPFLAMPISKIMGPKVQLLEAGVAVVRKLNEGFARGLLAGKAFQGAGKLRIMLSDLRPITQETARRWLGTPAEIEKAAQGTK